MEIFHNLETLLREQNFLQVQIVYRSPDSENHAPLAFHWV